jgi:flagellar biogenesis protein FliO
MEGKSGLPTSDCSRAEALRATLNWRQLADSLWHRILHTRRRLPKSLRLCESLSLGERRFLAVVECEGSRFLVGGTASSLAMLTRLDSETGRQPFHQDDHSSPTEDVG